MSVLAENEILPTVFITKYALTKGILEGHNAEISKNSSTMIYVKLDLLWESYFHKPYWHTNRDEAVTQAEDMRQKKLASLTKSVKKLQNLKF